MESVEAAHSEAPSSAEPKKSASAGHSIHWLPKVGRCVTKPIRNLWAKDTAFHTRLTSFVGIVAVLAGIIVPIAIAANAQPQPVVVVPKSAPKPQIKDSLSGPCPRAVVDGIQSCVLGRNSSDFLPAIRVSTTTVFTVQLYYENATKVQQDNVVVRVELPNNLKYLNGTTFLHTSVGNGLIRDGINSGGLNIGSYSPSGNAYLKFSLAVSENPALDCGENVQVVSYIVVASSGNRHAALPVTISKAC